MAREIIQVGATANDGQGDPIRTAFIKTNSNFGELYSKIQLVPPVALTGSVGDTAGMTAYDQEYYYYCFANYNGSSVIWRQVPNALQANVVAISATGNVVSNGNIAASYFIGDGSQLTNVSAGAGIELINGNTNITTATNGNANITINGASNVAVFTTTGVDITGAITGNSISVTGNTNSGNVSATGRISATGIVTGGNIATGGTVSATGNITGGTLNTAGTGTFGNVNTGGVISATGNIATGSNISATGNVTGNFIIGDGGFLSNVTVTSNVSVSQIANGTSILSVNGSGGNILVTVGGVSNVAQFVSYGLEVPGNVNSANIYLTGRFVSAGNVTGGNVLATSDVIATGNVKGTHVNSDLTMSAVGNIQAGNVRTAGSVSATGNVTGNYFNGNGSLLTGLPPTGLSWTTTANVAPTSPKPGDFWYNSYNGVKYQYTNDGVGNVWVDQSSPTSFATLTVSGTATTGNLLTGGVVSATGNVTGNYFIGNGSQLTDITSSYGNSNVGVYLASYTGNITANIISATGNVTGTYFIGTATQALYADLAENYVADADYIPGTVVEFGGEFEITVSTASHSTRVAGVISTNPGYLMNSAQAGKSVLAVALTGRVPCQVIGIIHKGDRLVSSNILGVAQAMSTDLYEPGCIIGKALEDYNSTRPGVIEVAVGRI